MNESKGGHCAERGARPPAPNYGWMDGQRSRGVGVELFENHDS